MLDLGPRRYSSRITAHQIYPKRGIIRGYVEVNNIENTHSIEVKLIGSVKNTLSESNGTVISHSKRYVLDISKTLFDSKHDSFAQPTSSLPNSNQKRLPFHIQLPHCSEDGETPLPPSFNVTHARTSSQVKYTVQVEMKKKGMRRNESLKTEIYYLPASVAQSSSQWEVSNSLLISLYSDSIQTRSVQFRLPPQRYLPAGYPIHFNYETRDKAIAQALRDQAQIKPIKRIDLNINGTRSKKESMLGRSDIWSIEEVKGMFVVAGSVVGGCPGGNAAWSVDGMVEVSYHLRIEVDAHLQSSKPSTPPLHLKFLKEEPLALTSHEIESGTIIPAMGMLRCLAQRCTVSAQ